VGTGLAGDGVALTRHVEPQLALGVLAHLDPVVLAGLRLLEVDDVVPGRTVAVAVEAELVAAEACGWS